MSLLFRQSPTRRDHQPASDLLDRMRSAVARIVTHDIANTPYASALATETGTLGRRYHAITPGRPAIVTQLLSTAFQNALIVPANCFAIAADRPSLRHGCLHRRLLR
jgi:hypothetical protein